MTSAAKGLKLGDNSFLTFQPIEVKFLHVDSVSEIHLQHKVESWPLAGLPTSFPDKIQALKNILLTP